MSRAKFLSTFCVLALIQLQSTSAADDASPLDLVPRDAAAFLHVRVADIYKNEAIKPLRDLMLQTNLKDLKKETGFDPADIDTVTVIIPQIGGSPIDGSPLVLVRTIKPYDKLKILTALRALTPAQANDWRNGPEFDHFDGGHRMAKPAIRIAPMQFEPVPEPKFDVPKGLKEPKDPKELFFVAQIVKEEEHDHPHHRDASRPWLKPDLAARHYLVGSGDMRLFIVDERTVMFGSDYDHGQSGGAMFAYCVKMLKRAESGPLDGALAEASKHTLTAGLNVKELAKNGRNELPRDLERFKPLLAAQSAVLTFDLNEQMTLTATLTATDAAGAKKIEDALHALLSLVKEKAPDIKKEAKNTDAPELAAHIFALGEKALNSTEIKLAGNSVTATTSARLDAGLADICKAAVGQLRIAGERHQAQNNLKQIGLAIHNYHAAQMRLPFPGVGRGGAPLGQGNNNPNLSWRVAILPYLEEENLYRQFKLDEPWDSVHNKLLIGRMPKIFAPANGVKAERGHTFFQIFTGKEAFQSGMSIARITDGTANTLMVVEAGDAVPWTRPEDMLYDSKKGLPKLGAIFDGNFNALMGDGSVRYIRKTIPEKELRALITPSGGEVIDWNWEK